MRQRLAAFLFALAPAAGLAQPAAEACRAYAQAGEQRSGAAAVVLDRDLHLDRTTRKLGRQSVGSVLVGNGAIVLAQGPAVEMSFICLLADEQRVLFFHWVPRRDAPVLAQCRRAAAAGDSPGTCLETLLQVAEHDLAQLNAERFQEARESDLAAGGERAMTAFRRGYEAWRAYREAECARRGAPESDPARACLVELTRRRALDLR